MNYMNESVRDEFKRDFVQTNYDSGDYPINPLDSLYRQMRPEIEVERVAPLNLGTADSSRRISFDIDMGTCIWRKR